MKVIISSKLLAGLLNQIDFNKDDVVEVGGEKDELIIDTDLKCLRVHCEIKDHALVINQQIKRWDWLKQLVNEISEQPIILELDDNVLNIKISY